MNKTVRFLMVTTILLNVGAASAESNCNLGTEGDPTNIITIDIPHKCPKPIGHNSVAYNASTTALTVKFSSNGQGGKVEIYHNGAKVVNVAVPAGASLNYVLRNYGKGEFRIIVSSGNNVVYKNCVIVK